MAKALKRVLIGLGVIVLVAVLIVGAYLAYLTITYYRIPDGIDVNVENNPSVTLKKDTAYTAATFNIGFGAYTPDYTFFMDEGAMADGTKTVGEHSTAASKESVEKCTDGAIDILRRLDTDFALLQEVDTDSTRSYNVNQKEAVEAAFPGYSSAFAENYHSGFLAYPLTDMHGIVNGGLLTVGSAHVNSAQRRSYPVDNGFIKKFFDLDRCFLVERLPVDGGNELVLINSHMSAFDEGGRIRAQQLEMLCSMIQKEAVFGNYVIVGGDWNHALCDSIEMYESKQLVPPWVATFSESDLPSGFTVVRPRNIEEVATCRGVDIPYEKGVTYRVTVDGFIVSDNVIASAENIDAGFQYSDHNPVKLTFTLK